MVLNDGSIIYLQFSVFMREGEFRVYLLGNLDSAPGLWKFRDCIEFVGCFSSMSILTMQTMSMEYLSIFVFSFFHDCLFYNCLFFFKVCIY